MADAGYWSAKNATAQVAESLLIVTRQRHNYGGRRPLSGEHRQVLEEIRAGRMTRRQGAKVLGISESWMRETVQNHEPDPDPSAVVPPDQRQEIMAKVAEGTLTIRSAAHQLGLSYSKVTDLLGRHRQGLPDVAVIQQQMDRELSKPENEALVARRKTAIEPVFGNIKRNLGYRSFVRRGRRAVNSEWRLICAAHNLLKLWRLAPTG